MTSTITAARPGSALGNLEGTAWYRNEDIPTTIIIDDNSAGDNNIDLSNATLKMVIKESTTPPSIPLHEYTSESTGGITIKSKNADKIVAECVIEKTRLSSLPDSTEVQLEAQLIICDPTSILKRVKFTSKPAI